MLQIWAILYSYPRDIESLQWLHLSNGTGINAHWQCCGLQNLTMWHSL